MGCFNMRCCVSNANIIHGDEIAVIPFNENKHYGMSICAPVFFGVYNDYGWLEEVCADSQKTFELFQKQMSALYHRGHVKLDSYTERELERNPIPKDHILDLGQLGDIFHRSALFLNDPKSQIPRQVGYMFVHRGIYEKMIQGYDTRTSWYKQQEKVIDKVAMGITPPKVAENLKIGADRVHLESERAKKVLQDLMLEIRFQVLDMYETMNGLNDDYKKMAGPFNVTESEENLQLAIHEIAKYLQFEAKMMEWNIPYANTESTGQEYSYTDGIKYHQMCLGILEQKQKHRDDRYEAEWGDEEDAE